MSDIVDLLSKPITPIYCLAAASFILIIILLLIFISDMYNLWRSK